MPAERRGHRGRLPDVLAPGLRLPTGSAGGYGEANPFDLAKFVVGSEGTLVVATGALVDLVPKPSRTVIAVGHFTTDAAIAATEDALSCDPHRSS